MCPIAIFFIALTKWRQIYEISKLSPVTLKPREKNNIQSRENEKFPFTV